MKAICAGGSSAAFFWDPDVWEKLKRETIPHLIINKKEGSVLRIWVGNCSTGQWAYTVLIVFLEVIEELRPDAGIKLQVLASDIDGERVEFAKKGLYLNNIAVTSLVSGVNKVRLKRFFNKEGNRYRVKDEIREMVEFSVRDLVDDEPLTEIDFLFCKWLLQYFDLEVKLKFISRFMESLVPGGVLFLDDKVYYRHYYIRLPSLEGKSK